MSLSPRSVAFSAFRAGTLVSVLVRPSHRSFTGVVVVCRFGCPRRACAFARRWAVRLGVPVAVAAGGWQVSIPVTVSHSQAHCFGGLLSFIVGFVALFAPWVQQGLSVVANQSSQFLTVGFSGSRSLAGPAFGQCQSLASHVSSLGASVLVGCAAGADAAARQGVAFAGGSPTIFTAQSSRPYHLIARSCQFVCALAAAPAPVLVSFPGRPCPSRLSGPSVSWSSCGSGSWSSAALALGLGVPVVFFGVSIPPRFGLAVPALAPFAGGLLVHSAVQRLL